MRNRLQPLTDRLIYGTAAAFGPAAADLVITVLDALNLLPAAEGTAAATNPHPARERTPATV